MSDGDINGVLVFDARGDTHDRDINTTQPEEPKKKPDDGKEPDTKSQRIIPIAQFTKVCVSIPVSLYH